MTDVTPPVPAPAAGLNPALKTLLALASAVIVCVGLYYAAPIFGPLMLGAVFVIICHPVRKPLERAGWPSWLATLAVILVAFSIVGVLVWMLAWAGIQFAAMVAGYSNQLYAFGQSVFDWLVANGLDHQAADAAAAVLRPSVILDFLGSLSGTVSTVLLVLFLVLSYVIFMSADAARYSTAEAKLGPDVKPLMARFVEYCSNVRKYFIVNAGFGLVIAVIDGLALWAFGIPAPVVWAILAFVTNFIPNVGFVIGLIPPAVLALVVGGLPMFLTVVAIYCVVNVVLSVFVEAKFIADAVALSLTLSFFSVIFWSLLLGPLGAVLSIPLTLLVRAMLIDTDPSARWLRWLSGVEETTARPVT